LINPGCNHRNISDDTAGKNYAYGTRITFYSTPVIDQPDEDENYYHKDFDESEPVLRLS
jgi:hypothetical protein